MTHNHKRGEWYKEGAISMLTGTLYGAANTLTGHPLDTVKAKMQAHDVRYATNGGMVDTMKLIYRNEGMRGFYRGVVPPMWGSVAYRSMQFSVFESVYTKLDNDAYKKEIPMSGGIQLRTFCAAFLGASSRSVLESPIEYAKVRRQTGQQWHLRHVYDGFTLQWARTCPMMTIYFLSVDSLRRHTNMFDSFWGQFVASGGSAMFGFWCVWPLETLKNQVQAGTKIPGISNPTVLDRIRADGVRGLYRGILPGSLSVFSRNGAAMIVMQKAQQKVNEWGLRD